MEASDPRDFRNRLVQVTDASGNEVAHYEYDAFNRRVVRAVGGSGGETRATVWHGWQAVEEYVVGVGGAGDRLVSRRTYGLGLDEIVQLESDLDGSGTVSSKYVLVYDSGGNVVEATDLDGKPVERYEYTPYGEQKILVDSTPPAVEQVRVRRGKPQEA